MVFGSFKKSTIKSKNKVVFLDVPKTAGSTFVGLFHLSIQL